MATPSINGYRLISCEYIVGHGFKHALRERLRAVNTQKEVIGQIGHWPSGKIGES